MAQRPTPSTIGGTLSASPRFGIETIVVGLYEVNSYLFHCSCHQRAIALDPGDNADQIARKSDEIGASITKIVNTHGHADHTGGVRRLMELTGAKFYLSEAERDLIRNQAMLDMAAYLGIDPSPTPDRFMTDQERIELCPNVWLELIHTPGHTPGGASFLARSEPAMEPAALFTGDTLFRMSVGRVDLPGGEPEKLIDSIKRRLLPLDETTVIYPGHGPTSTIGAEKEYNPFLR